MSLESARAWLADRAPELPIIEVEESTATVAEAAAALGVEPGRIAKTLCVRAGAAGGEVVLIVARGDARLDNAKFKGEFGARPRMLGPDETLALTGHPVGGVCPFGVATPLPVYCDISLRGYELVYPAAGSLNSSVEVTPARLAQLVAVGWIDVCRTSAAGEP